MFYFLKKKCSSLCLYASKEELWLLYCIYISGYSSNDPSSQTDDKQQNAAVYGKDVTTHGIGKWLLK